MRFIVYRTSGYEDKIPCEEAVKNIIAEETIWSIDINSLEDLLLWRDKIGESIIIHKNEDNDQTYIEIYDDWRE